MDEDYFGQNSRYVKELSPQDFNELSAYKLKTEHNKSKKCGNASGMVLFYAPWCGYCKAVAPAWEEAAKISGFCNFYAFNCEKNKGHLLKIREENPSLVKNYPTIIYYKNGEPIREYEGNRDVQSFVSFCMNMCNSK